MTMDEVLSRENLNAAYRVVKANAGAPGVDGMSVEELKEHVRKHWETLQSKLRAGEYQPAAVRAVEIPKAKGGVRTLGIPTVVDRLIQQGVHQVLSPIFEKDFSNHSYGFRPGRSAQDAVRAAQEYVKAGKGWVVDIDLKAFFDQVNHDKLMNLVGRKIRDKEILKLIGKYLRGELGSEDHERFQRRYLTVGYRRKMVESAKALLLSGGGRPALTSGPHRSVSWWKRFLRRR